MARSAAQSAARGQSPAQRAGSASSPGDPAPVAADADPATAAGATNVGTSEMVQLPDPGQVVAGSDAAAAAVTDPAIIAATVERGTGQIPYEIDGREVSHHEYAEHVAAQARAEEEARLAEAEVAMGRNVPRSEQVDSEGGTE